MSANGAFLSSHLEDPHSIDSPSVIVNLQDLQHNISDWATSAGSSGVKLRPHIKTHKCFEIADMQLKAGASGFTVATLSEAEAMIKHGYDNIFQAYPLWLGSGLKQSRYLRIIETGKFIVGVDSADAVKRLSSLTPKSLKGNVSVMVELNSGQDRTGVKPAEVPKIARCVLKNKLSFSGVFTHGGHAYEGSVAEAARDEVRSLTEAVELLQSHGIRAPIVSAGSTPTTKASSVYPVNEQRPGVYVFGDHQQVTLGVAKQNEIALFVLSTVVSSHEGRFVLDAGSKILSTDKPDWLHTYGALPDFPHARIAHLSEHHAVVETSGASPKRGEVVAVIPNHVCATVNLVDEMVVVSRKKLVDVWSVALRGLNT